VASKRKITPRQYTETATGIRLSVHEKLCAERMQTLIDSIKDLRKDVNDLKATVNKGKGMIALLVFLGGVAATILGYLKLKF
jgi:hypothetical protein